MVLSERLESILHMVPPSRCVADVCCDHAQVAVELVRRGRAERAIACDLRRGPLQRAAQYIREAGLGNAIETRQGDGLDTLAAGEAETVVLAGIGGDLMLRILTGRLRDFGTFILSPQSMHGKLRHFLYDNGMEIQEERMIREGGKYYLILRTSHIFLDNIGKNCADNTIGGVPTSAECGFTYGFQLLARRDAVLYDYLLREKRRFEAILRQTGLERVKREYRDCLCALEVYG